MRCIYDIHIHWISNWNTVENFRFIPVKPIKLEMKRKNRIHSKIALYILIIWSQYPLLYIVYLVFWAKWWVLVDIPPRHIFKFNFDLDGQSPVIITATKSFSSSANHATLNWIKWITSNSNLNSCCCYYISLNQYHLIIIIKF